MSSQILAYLTDGSQIVQTVTVSSYEEVERLNEQDTTLSAFTGYWTTNASDTRWPWMTPASEAWEAWSRASARAERLPVGTTQESLAWKQADALWEEYIAAKKAVDEEYAAARKVTL